MLQNASIIEKIYFNVELLHEKAMRYKIFFALRKFAKVDLSSNPMQIVRFLLDIDIAWHFPFVYISYISLVGMYQSSVNYYQTYHIHRVIQ